MIGGSGISAMSSWGWPAQQAGLIALRDNALLTSNRYHRAMSIAGSAAVNGVANAIIGGNAVSIAGGGIAAFSGDVARPDSFLFGDAVSGANQYLCPVSRPFERPSLSASLLDWQGAGFDVAGASHSSVDRLGAAVGWRSAYQLADGQGRDGWARDIVSYMQSIDPSYFPDDEVTVDDGAPLANRRPNAAPVWRVLRDFVGFPHDHGSRPQMSEVDARLAARRYHAFLTFIERAKANRKGAWDVRYTADAVNSYVREGLGKSSVGGPYTAGFPVVIP
jgi:hypothetical protein